MGADSNFGFGGVDAQLICHLPPSAICICNQPSQISETLPLLAYPPISQLALSFQLFRILSPFLCLSVISRLFILSSPATPLFLATGRRWRRATKTNKVG